MFMRTIEKLFEKGGHSQSQYIFIDFNNKNWVGEDSWKIKDELPTFHS